MVTRKGGLSFAQIASLDAAITAAQAKGLNLDDRLEKNQEQAEAMMEIHEAMWEARHGGLEIAEHDREVLSKVRELLGTLEMSPTLGQLVDLRAEAVRESGR